jgi:hypothetical protein
MNKEKKKINQPCKGKQQTGVDHNRQEEPKNKTMTGV